MLPKNLSYKGKIESAACRSYKANIAPQNGTGPYSLGDTVIINIPTRNNLCMSTLDSYLKFTLPSITSGAADSGFRWGPGGANGLISRIRVWSGSNLLEDITEYGLLASMMNDLQVSTDSFYGKNTILQGTRNDLVVTFPTHTTYTSADNVAANIKAGVDGCFASLDGALVGCNQINSGAALADSAAPYGAILASGKTTTENTYCLNLISILGSLCSAQYFPLFACKSSAIRLEITLVSSLVNAGAVLGTLTTPNGVMKNVEFVCQMLELSDSAMGTISQSLQGQPLQFVVPTYKNLPYTTNSMTNGTTNSVSFAIACKVSSLKSIFITQRDKGAGGNSLFSAFNNYRRNYRLQF